jgi:hypothetical protein
MGPVKTLLSTETWQTEDYAKYGMTMFDEGARKKRREEVFPQDRQKAFDWQAGGHTPRLAAVKLLQLKKVVKRSSNRGMAPGQYNKFPIQRRYPGLAPGYLHLGAGLCAEFKLN